MKGKLLKMQIERKNGRQRLQKKIGSFIIKLVGSIWLSNIFLPLPEQLSHYSVNLILKSPSSSFSSQKLKIHNIIMSSVSVSLSISSENVTCFLFMLNDHHFMMVQLGTCFYVWWAVIHLTHLNILSKSCVS